MTIAHWFRNAVGGNAAPEVRLETLEETSEALRDQILRSADRVEQIARDLALKGERLQMRKHAPTPIALEASEFESVVQCKPKTPFRARKMRRHFVVKGEYGIERGEPGDYLVTLPTGRQIAMTSAEFRDSFKPA